MGWARELGWAAGLGCWAGLGSGGVLFGIGLWGMLNLKLTVYGVQRKQ